MYCNKCGHPVHAGDIFCSKCGSRLSVFETEKATEEIPEEKSPYRIDTSEFVWDVPEFASRAKDPEKVTVDWASGTMHGEQEAARAAEPVFIAAAAAAKPEEEPDIPGIDDVRPVEISDIEADIASENRDRMRDTAKIEKFYTFNQKNEEFQKLLDREYERIKNGRGADEEEVFDPVAHLKKAEEARNAVAEHNDGTAIMANDEIIRKFDTMELEKDLLESTSGPQDDVQEPKKERGFQSIILDELFGPKAAGEGEATVPEVQSEQEASGGMLAEAAAPVVPANFEEGTDSGGEDGQPRKKRRTVGKIIIVIMVILLICELAALGITRFMPESDAAYLINNKLVEITKMIH